MGEMAELDVDMMELNYCTHCGASPCECEQPRNLAKPNAQPALDGVAALLYKAIATDGAHHKQWYIERIADRLGIELPAHDEGIAP